MASMAAVRPAVRLWGGVAVVLWLAGLSVGAAPLVLHWAPLLAGAHTDPLCGPNSTLARVAGILGYGFAAVMAVGVPVASIWWLAHGQRRRAIVVSAIVLALARWWWESAPHLMNHSCM